LEGIWLHVTTDDDANASPEFAIQTVGAGCAQGAPFNPFRVDVYRLFLFPVFAPRADLCDPFGVVSPGVIWIGIGTGIDIAVDIE
jgi:hypothetical protein